jgi:hypothetical protein
LRRRRSFFASQTSPNNAREALLSRDAPNLGGQVGGEAHAVFGVLAFNYPYCFVGLDAWAITFLGSSASAGSGRQKSRSLIRGSVPEQLGFRSRRRRGKSCGGKAIDCTPGALPLMQTNVELIATAVGTRRRRRRNTNRSCCGHSGRALCGAGHEPITANAPGARAAEARRCRACCGLERIGRRGMLS